MYHNHTTGTLLTIQDLARIYGVKSRQQMHNKLAKWKLAEWKLPPSFVAAQGSLKLYSVYDVKYHIDHYFYSNPTNQALLRGRLEEVTNELRAFCVVDG